MPPGAETWRGCDAGPRRAQERLIAVLDMASYGEEEAPQCPE